MKTYLEGLEEAHRLLREEHARLEREHHAASGNFLGWPTKRHHEIMGASRALTIVATRIFQTIKAEASKPV
jgi:hypothetical protein